jgi:4-amino-4-deoxy-L-arabinose transferase-like glycosyltransferase
MTLGEPQLRQDSGARWAALVLVLAALVAAVAIGWTSTAFSTDYSEGVYWQSLLSLDAGHPIFTSVFSSQPPLFLVSLLPLFHLFGPSVVAARVGTLVFGLVGVAGVWALGRRTSTTSGLLAAALVLSVAPFVLMFDSLEATTPSVAMSTVGVAVASAAARRSGRARLGWAALAGIVVASATMIKLLGIVAAVPAVLFLLLPPSALPDDASDGVAESTSWRSRFPSAVVLVVALLAGVAIVSVVFWSHGDMWDQVVGFHVNARGLRSGPLFNLKVLTYATLTTPALLAGAVATVIVIVRRIRPASIYVAWLATCGVFLLLQHPLFSPHKMVLVPPAALVVAGLPTWLARSDLAGRAGERVGRWAQVVVSGVVILGLVGLAYDTSEVRHAASPSRQAIVDALRAEVPPGVLVVSDDPVAVAASGRLAPPALVDTSNVRFDSDDLTADELIRITDAEAGAVLLTGGRFDKAPEFAEWVKANFTETATFPNGAVLYTRR